MNSAANVSPTPATPAPSAAASPPTAAPPATTGGTTAVSAASPLVSPNDDPSGPTPFTIYNTGVDNSGTPLADGSVDPHYTITAAPSPYTPGSAYDVDQNSYPFYPTSYWLPDGDGLSNWIGPVANESNDPSGTYTYETTFNLTGYDSSTAIITGQYQSDNWLSEIILNGQVVADFPSNGASNFQLWQALPEISSGFVPGVNTLEFVTTNYVQATGNPTGFRVELQGSADQLAWQGPSYSWTQTPVANPTVTTPAAQTNTEGDNVSLQIQASDPNGYALSYDAVDLPPGLSINSSTGLISGTVASGAAEDFDGSYNPTIIVSNNQGGSTTTSFSWTINQAQVAPVLTSPGDQSNLTGDNVNLQINGTQADGDAISYYASNLPNGLSIDSETGIISGTVGPTSTPGVPNSVTVTAVDNVTNVSSSVTFNWTITASTAAPVWTAPGNQSNAVGDEVDLQLSASDANQDALTYTATGLPPGLTLDPIDATITGTLPASAASSTPYNVTVTASNGISSSSQSFTWTVSPISLPNPGDQSNLDGDTVSLPITATDANNDTLSYSATGLPSGLSINSSSGLISGTISNTADANSPYSVTVTASDSAGNSASQSFNWTVAPLALNPINDQENQEGTAVSLQVSADDNVGTPTYSASGLPDGVTINSTTGLISGTVGIGAYGSSPYQVTVTATDGDNTSSQSFVWTVTPRVALSNPGPQSNATGDNVSLQVSASSPGGTMSYSATGLPDGLSIDTSTGIISGTIAADAASSTPYNVTVTANDGTSGSSQTFQWTVSVINLVSPGDQTNNDGDTVSLPLTTTYNGNGTLSYSATGLPTGLNISSTTGEITGNISGTADTNSPYSVTVTATDGTNTSTQTFNWTVNPVVTIDAIDDQSNADGDVVSLQVSAEDSLNNTLTYSATGLPPGLNIASTTGLISGTISAGADANSPYAVTVTATDSAGLSATQTFNWNVAPVGLVNPGPLLSVDGQAVSLQLPASSGATFTATGLPSGLSINSSTGLISGTLASNADTSSPYIVTATATLGSNNISQTFVWTVMPVGLIAPSDQTNTEGDNVSLQLQGLSSGGTLSYSAAGLPDGLSIDSNTGLITGIIAAGDAANGPYTVDVAVTNGTVSASQSFTWNINPVVNLTAPSDQTNYEGDNVSLQLSATDAFNNTLSYSADGLPSGLSINSTSGLISGSIAAGDFSGGPYVVLVTASDGTYSSSQTFTWNILQTNPTTPTMTNPGTQVNVAGDSVNLQIDASDADGDALTYSATNLPDGLAIDPYLGLISGTVADDAMSPTPYQVTVTATDGNGLSASQTFSWLVNAPALTATAMPISAVAGTDTGSVTVATFTTPDLNSQSSDFTALINYGDGTTDMGTVSGQNGSFTVTGDNTYAQSGTYPVSVIISDANGWSTTATSMASVTAATLTATGGFDLGAIQGQSSNLTLATFTSSNPNMTAANFTATIDWGDGSGALPATVIDLGDGLFGVSGNHAYTLNGAYTATISITGSDGSTANTTSTVTVGNLYADTPSTLTVASFTDSDASIPASSFTATINWGDGNQSAGTVVGSNGVFQVQGAHTYTQDSIDQTGGVYTVTVTVSDSSGDTLTSSSAVTVVRPPIVLNTGNVATAPNTLSLTNVQVAVFTVPDGLDASSEYSETINWGDNSSSAGTIEEVGPGEFAVVGSHTYANAGAYQVTVAVSQGWQNQELTAEKGLTALVSIALLPLVGPTVVPGNSIYTYFAPLLGAVVNPKNPWVITTPPAYSAQEPIVLQSGQTLIVLNGKPTLVEYADVEFFNHPVVASIGLVELWENSFPILVFTTQVNVVAVDVNLSVATEKTKLDPGLGPPTTQQLPLQVATTPNPTYVLQNYYGDDVSAFQFTGRTLGVEPYVNVPASNSMHPTTFEAVVPVRIISPDPGDPGIIAQIQVGLIQIANARGFADYKNDKTRTLYIGGQESQTVDMLDWLLGANNKKAAGNTTYGPPSPPNQPPFAPGVVEEQTGLGDPAKFDLWPWYNAGAWWNPPAKPTDELNDTIAMTDNPGAAWPVYFDGVKKQGPLSQGNFSQNFTLYLAARTTQNYPQFLPISFGGIVPHILAWGSSDQLYYSEAYMLWSLGYKVEAGVEGGVGNLKMAGKITPYKSDWAEQETPFMPNVNLAPTSVAGYPPFESWVGN